MFYIFDQKGKNIGSCDFEPNYEDLATRNEVAVEFNQEFSGELMLVNNKINIIEPQPSKFHELVNGKWVISEEKATALLNENKQILLTEIANIVDETKSKMLVGYSQAEVESFYKQEQEALAYQADKNASTPMLRQIAENRGVPFEILVQKVIEKSNLFAAAIGSVIGQRQAFEDRIEAVTTQEELEEIEREIEQWKN